jgi:hypothetical protein
MSLGALIHVQSFIKIGSGVQNLIGGGYTDTHTRTHGQKHDLKCLLYFFKLRIVD